FTTPKAARSLIETAIRGAVGDGKLWLTSAPASVLGEEIPAGILSEDGVLQAPPPPIAAAELLPENVPTAWQEGTATALSISNALSNKIGKVLPWLTVRRAIDGAFNGRLLERVEGQWPCEYAVAQTVKLRVPSEKQEAPPPPPPPRPGLRIAEAQLRPNEI